MFLDFHYELTINALDDFEEKPCNPEMNLKFDETLYKLANEDLEKQYGCTIPFLPATSSNVTGIPTEICKDEQVAQKAMNRYSDIESSQLGTHMPCARMDIFMGMPSITNNSEVENPHPYMGYGLRDKAFVLLYFKTDIKVKRTVYDYDFLTLVAEMGGYIGLLIGMSLTELILHTNSFIVKLSAKKYAPNRIQD